MNDYLSSAGDRQESKNRPKLKVVRVTVARLSPSRPREFERNGRPLSGLSLGEL